MGQYNDQLYHAGVLGMKWGHHKIKYESNIGTQKTLDEENATRNHKIAKILAVTGALTLTAASVYIMKNEHDKNWTNTIIKEGTILKRMSQTQDGSLSMKTFVSFLPKDNEKYSKFKGYGGNIYQVSLKSVNRIVAPSNHTVDKMWSKVISENKNIIQNDPNIRQFSNTLFSKNKEIARSSIGTISRSSPIWTSFAKELSTAGYNAVIDYTDKGFTEKPIILLNAFNDVVNIGSKLMN